MQLQQQHTLPSLMTHVTSFVLRSYFVGLVNLLVSFQLRSEFRSTGLFGQENKSIFQGLSFSFFFRKAIILLAKTQLGFPWPCYSKHVTSFEQTQLDTSAKTAIKGFVLSLILS